MNIDKLIKAASQAGFEEELKELLAMKEQMIATDNYDTWKGTVFAVSANYVSDVLNAETYDIMGMMMRSTDGQVSFKDYARAVRNANKHDGLCEFTDGMLEIGYDIIYDLWHDNEKEHCNDEHGRFSTLYAQGITDDKGYLKEDKKQYLVPFTTTELTLLKDLLMPMNDTKAGEQVLGKIDDAQQSGSPNDKMVFFNVYEVEQHYGGPEEGGWYYHTSTCVQCIGYAGWMSQAPSEDVEWEKDILRQMAHDYDLVIHDGPLLRLPESIARVFDENATITVAEDRDNYGNGFILQIQRNPGQSHDVRTQHYE